MIGPNSIITDSTIGDDCTVFASVVERAGWKTGLLSAPSHTCALAPSGLGCKLGNYAEIKNSSMGEGCNAPLQLHR